MNDSTARVKHVLFSFQNFPFNPQKRTDHTFYHIISSLFVFIIANNGTINVLIHLIRLL